MRLTRIALPVAAAAATCLLLAAAGARAQSIEEKASVCAGCHGEKGVPVDKTVPVISGQNEGYLYLELRDYKQGHRQNEIMSQIAAGLERQDMRDLAAYFAKQPWPNLGQPRAPADLAKQAEAIDGSAACKGCHLAEWQGDSTTPRLAGQGQQYLHDTMAAFRSGARANNPWMAALLKTYKDADIDALAAYLAGY